MTSQYESRYSEVKTNLEADCKKIVDETAEYARKGMEEFKNEEQTVIKEMREERNRQEEQAAELNVQLQERVGEFIKVEQAERPEPQDRRTWWRSRRNPAWDVCNAKRVCKREGWSNTHAKHSNEQSSCRCKGKVA